MNISTPNIRPCFSKLEYKPSVHGVLLVLALKCKIDAECSYQTFVQIAKEVLRNRQLRQHANIYMQRRISYVKLTLIRSHKFPCHGDSNNLQWFVVLLSRRFLTNQLVSLFRFEIRCCGYWNQIIDFFTGQPMSAKKGVYLIRAGVFHATRNFAKTK